MSGSSGASFVTGAMMFAPITGWAFISARSSFVSLSGLFSTSSRTPILPMSCRSPPHSRASSSLSDSLSTRPMSTEICCTRRLWPAVNASLASTAPARLLTVCVNISRISMYRPSESLIRYTGKITSRIAHQPTPGSTYTWLMSQARGTSARKVPTKVGVSPRTISIRFWPPRRLSTSDAMMRFATKKTVAPSAADAKLIAGLERLLLMALLANPPRIAGRASPA